MWPPKNDHRENFLIFFVLFLFIQPMGLGSELGHTARFLATVNNFYFINLKLSEFSWKDNPHTNLSGFSFRGGNRFKIRRMQAVS